MLVLKEMAILVTYLWYQWQTWNKRGFVETKWNLLVDVVSLVWTSGTAEIRDSNRDIRAVFYHWYPDFEVKSDSSWVVLWWQKTLAWIIVHPWPCSEWECQATSLKHNTFIHSSLPSTCSPPVVTPAASCSSLWVMLDGIIFLNSLHFIFEVECTPYLEAIKFWMAEGKLIFSTWS